MTCDFVHFCSCGSSDYTLLKERIEQCAISGHSYEFHHCRMLPHCTPVEATVGFWYHQGSYHLYFRPSIVYDGTDGRLAFFFRQPIHSFASFEGLILTLMVLGEEAVPSLRHKHTTPALYCQIKGALGELVFGQEHAIEAVAFKLYGHISKKNPTRPLSLIFYGPTGVGKSELGKGLASVLNQCAGQYQFVWTELNTFTEAHSVYRLTGAPPGYVGYDDRPIFETVQRNPKTVFMFDELEKAHPEVLKVFMSILDEGRCTAHKESSNGERELDFRRCIFLFTTNADLSRCTKHPLGFSVPASQLPQTPVSPAPLSGATLPQLARRLFQEDEAARRALVNTGVLKEIAGRFSGLIGFQDLDHSTRVAITKKQITALGREYGLNITHIAPHLAEALTPKDGLSSRSTVGILEGVLTPILLSAMGQTPPQRALGLIGRVEEMCLIPL